MTTVATAAPCSLSNRLSTRGGGGGGVVVFRRRPLYYSSGWLYDSRWAAEIDGP